MRPRRSAAAALAALALSGCANLPLGSDGLSYDERRVRLEAVEAWESRGRLAVDTGERGGQASFRWTQSGDALELTVRGPFGGGVLQVTGTPRELTVTTRGETRVLLDPETELSALLGWWLPVGSLHAWLLGLPDRAFPENTELGAEGTLRALEQRLWRIDYVSYQLGSGEPGSDRPQPGSSEQGSTDAAGAQPSGADAGLLVPRRIDLMHGDLHVRLTIDDWQVVAP
jgi:outer membrane lipoprotein LolB